MVRRCAVLVAGALLMSQQARAQSAGQALDNLLVVESERAVGAHITESALKSFLVNEATTFPLGSSSGGFTWVFDPNLGVETRRSQSFGPIFAERPLSSGKHRFNLGLAYQHTSFASVGGQPLGDLRSTRVFSGAFSGYVDTKSSSISVKTDRTIINATYGVTGRLDIGVAVPLGHTSVSGTTMFTETFNGQPRLSNTTNSIGSSSGIGDVVLRAKAVLPSAGPLDLAIGADARLPTGDPDKLLGTNTTQGKLMLISAVRAGIVSPHINVGYTFGGHGLSIDSDPSTGLFSLTPNSSPQPSQEVNYTFGADVAASSRVTVAGDVIGRSLRHSAEFVQATLASISLTTLQLRPGTVNLLLGAVGTKINVGGTWLLTASVLFPLNDSGVKPNVTPMVGFERGF